VTKMGGPKVTKIHVFSTPREGSNRGVQKGSKTGVPPRVLPGVSRVPPGVLVPKGGSKSQKQLS
jgi:hypothetical protein